MKKTIIRLFIVLITTVVAAQTPKNIDPATQLALQGYDPVAYFESNKAIQGNKEITATYNGAQYCFSSEKNKALFLKNPEQFEPRFGGFCAYGMSNGYEAPIQPEAFTIVDNKLYLNYNLKVKEMWLKEQAARIDKANENWEKRNTNNKK